MPFTEWITGKYQEWRGGKTGREGGISEYARWLGLSQQVVNGWINDGSIPNRKKSIDALVARYGNEVYEILGIDPPETDSLAWENLSLVQKAAALMWAEAPDELREKYRQDAINLEKNAKNPEEEAKPRSHPGPA